MNNEQSVNSGFYCSLFIVHCLLIMSKYDEIKQLAYKANMQLPELGLVLFTFGNVSAADRNEGVFAIKPSGVPYAELSAR